MDQIFELYNKTSLTLVDRVQVVNTPVIHEELNGGYTLNFDIDYRDRNKLNSNVLVKADGQFFQIARIVKSRYETITLSVSAEHISYEMIINGSLEDPVEYESTASEIMSQILQGTRFSVGSVMSTGIEYYYSSDLDRRKRLFDVANLFGGELVFDNFTVSLVSRRGSDKGLDISLGVNLRGVTEEQNFIEGRTGYELDLVDLSKIPGYELNFSEVEIGDTITILDNKLGIDTNERILSIEYNPFQKALPTVTVGDYARDFTEYIKDDPEDEDEDGEEDERVITSFLSEFKVGKVDALTKGSDEARSVESWIMGEEKYLQAGSNYTVRKEKELKGLIITVKEEYNEFYHYLINTLQGDNRTSSVVLDLKNLGNISLATMETPMNENDSYVIFISERPIEELQVNPILIETIRYGAIGINIAKGQASGGQHLYKFDVGGESRLGDLSDEFNQAMSFVTGETTDIIATGEYLLKELKKEEITEDSGRFESFIGVAAELLEEYRDLNYYFYSVDTFIPDEGEPHTLISNWNDTLSPSPDTWKVPEDVKSESLTFIISEKSWDELRADPDLFYNSDFAAYGVTFKPDIKPDDPLNFFTRFDLQENDLMGELTSQNENIVRAFFDEIPPKTPENEFKITENQVGLFIEKAAAYGGDYMYLLDFKIVEGAEDDSGPDVVHYTSEQWEWNWTAVYKKRGIIIVMTKIPFDQLDISNIDENFICSFGVTIVNDGELMSNLPLKTFKINETSVLNSKNLDATDENWVEFEDYPDTRKPEKPAVYNTDDTIQTITLEMKPEYMHLEKWIVLYWFDGEWNRSYNDNAWNENGQITIDIAPEFQQFCIFVELYDGYNDAWVLWLDVNTGVEPPGDGDGDGDEDGEEIFFEYGSCPLSEYMTMQFENGPYGEIRSVTTGLRNLYTVSRNLETPTTRDISSENITIIVQARWDWDDGKYYELTAIPKNVENFGGNFGDLMVDFHAICVKNPRRPEPA